MRDGPQMPEYLTFLVVGLIRLRLRASPSRMKCIICDDPVIQRESGRGRRRLFCSPACKRVRQRQQAEQYYAEGRYRDRPRPHYPPKGCRGTCAVCEKPFRSLNKRQKTCSPRCGKIEGDRTRSASARVSQYATMRALRCAIPAGQPECQAASRGPCAALLLGRLFQGVPCAARANIAGRGVAQASLFVVTTR